jgi:16S rRNA (uracil1498-N3)-methyltransferase
MDQYFYSTRIYDDFIILPEDEAHHALKVLRKKIGDKITVVDGKGGVYESTFENVNTLNCKLKIIHKNQNIEFPKHSIHIGISPPKSHDRLEWFIEKSVEIGIQEISFILTDNSERKNVKLNRILKRTISSMKQSLKALMPKINDIEPVKKFMENCSNSEKFIAHLGEEERNHLIKIAPTQGDYCILIGPEGDFSDSEIKKSQKFGFSQVTLGDNRLRTETAGVAACHILNLVNEK